MAREKRPKLTPEDHAEHAELQRLLRERIAQRRALEREEEERRARRSFARRLLERLKLAA